ncbi:MAG: MFS transporter [Chloroflexota bacterium]|nr:MFS transporter [Chloroflexota bacterium]
MTITRATPATAAEPDLDGQTAIPGAIPAAADTPGPTGHAPEPDAPFDRSMRAIFRRPGFALLWLSQAAGGLGEAVAQVALPLLVYDLSGSARLLGLFFVIQTLPRVILAPVAGLLADRLDRRRLMFGSDLGRAILVGLIPFTASLWQLAVLAALVSVGNAVARPAEQATVPVIAGTGLMVPALAVVQVSQSLIRVIGPAIGALLVASAGPSRTFWLQTVCFAASAALIWRLRLPTASTAIAPDPAAAAVSRRAELFAGLGVIWSNRVVRGITAAEILWQVIGTMFVIGLVVYTEETIALGDRAETVFALLMATIAGGAAVGALVGNRIEPRIGRRRLLAIGYLGPLFLLPVGLVPPLPVVFACWFALGFTDAWAVIAMQAYLVEAVPDALRGRMYAAWSAIITLAAAAWFAIVGLVVPVLGAPVVFVLAGLIVGIGGPLALLLTGALATLRRGIDPAGRGSAPVTAGDGIGGP